MSKRSHAQINILHILSPTGLTYFLVSPNQDRVHLARFDLSYEARRVLASLPEGADPVEALLRADYAILSINRVSPPPSMVAMHLQRYRVEIQLAYKTLHERSPTLETLSSLLRLLDVKTGQNLLWKLNLYRLHDHNPPSVIFVHNGRGARFLKLLLRARQETTFPKGLSYY